MAFLFICSVQKKESHQLSFRYAVLLFLLLMLGFNFVRLLSYTPKTNEPLDYRQIYAGAQLFDAGLNPYNDSLLKLQWNSNFHPEELKGLPQAGGPENFLVYPPPFIASMIPLSRLPWDEARTWIWCVSAVLVLLIGLLLSGQFSTPQILLSFLMLLSFKGTYTALILGQPLLLSLFFILLHLYAERKKQKLWSGLFLALACLKPTLALPMVFFLFAERKYKTLLFTSVFALSLVLFLFLGLGAGTFIQLFTGWFQNMQAQSEIAFSEGHDFLRNNLTSLSSLIYSVGGPKLSALDLPVLFLSSIFIVILRLKKRLQSIQTLALLITLSFLFSYHLYYDLLLYCCLLYYVDLSTLRLKFVLPFLLFYLPWGYLFPSFNFHPLLLTGLIFLISLSRDTYASLPLKSE